MVSTSLRAVAVALCSLCWASPSWGWNEISVENARPGDPHWFRPIAPLGYVNLYASQATVTPGETLQLHVAATRTTRYSVLIYRLGWYQGRGARLVGCMPACGGAQSGVAYAVPALAQGTGFVDFGWPVTDSFHVPATAVSGLYLAEAVARTGPVASEMRYYPFVVTASPDRPASHVLVQIDLTTAEAYNAAGGKSLYRVYSSHHQAAVKVSFDRPFLTEGARAASLDSYRLVRFLERAGYDVSYTTDVGTDRRAGELRRHKLVIIDGHDEYWSKHIRDAFQSARNAGVNIADFGADTGMWQNRYEDRDRTIVEYRNASRDPEIHPELKTIEFSKLSSPRPPCELLGVQYTSGFGVEDPPVGEPRAYTVTAAAAQNSWFAGTGLSPGTVLPQLVGGEWDTLKPGCHVPPVTVLFHWTGTVDADSTVYTAPSGARVFSAGSLAFATGLDEWPASGHEVENRSLQRFALNLLTDLGGANPGTPGATFATSPNTTLRGPTAPAGSPASHRPGASLPKWG